MVLRQLEYLAALAREKHFGRAAEACHVSQPTLSAAIRLLEDDLGAPIVERGHRYVGLTPQGQVALEHAHRILAEVENLRRGLEEIDKGLTGRLRIGVIPTALPLVSQLTGPFYARFPGVTVAIFSMNSQEISMMNAWEIGCHEEKKVELQFVLQVEIHGKLHLKQDLVHARYFPMQG